MLGDSEFVIANAGYGSTRCIVPTSAQYSISDRLSILRASHETSNGGLMNFAILSTTFRHDRSLHSRCFFAVLHVVTVLLENDPIPWI